MAASPGRVAPGATADIRFTPPEAGFNLYLPHAGSTDAAQQGRGLFGPIVVEEADRADVDEDFVVVLSDWSFDDSGRIKDDFADPAAARGAGRRGSVVFANAAAAPLSLKRRPGARVRLRLGNAATARLTNVAIDGREPRSSRSTASRPTRSSPCATSSRWGPAPVSN